MYPSVHRSLFLFKVAAFMKGYQNVMLQHMPRSLNSTPNLIGLETIVCHLGDNQVWIGVVKFVPSCSCNRTRWLTGTSSQLDSFCFLPTLCSAPIGKFHIAIGFGMFLKIKFRLHPTKRQPGWQMRSELYQPATKDITRHDFSRYFASFNTGVFFFVCWLCGKVVCICI